MEYIQESPANSDTPAKLLTKREMFAAMAMQGMLSGEEDRTLTSTVKEAAELLGIPVESYAYTTHYPQLVAKSCVVYADALLDALGGGK